MSTFFVTKKQERNCENSQNHNNNKYLICKNVDSKLRYWISTIENGKSTASVTCSLDNVDNYLRYIFNFQGPATEIMGKKSWIVNTL